MEANNKFPQYPLITIFSNFNEPVKDVPFYEILESIKNGQYKDKISSIRSHLASGNTEKADNLKKQLPAFTPSATYSGGRKQEFLKTYSGIIHLDFDKIPESQLSKVKQAIIDIPFTLACFLSPSGKGFKVFVLIMTGANKHATEYERIKVYYEQMLGIPADVKCKDITRLCFVSYDPELYLNHKSLLFELPKTVPPPVETKPETPAANFDSVFEKCIAFTEQKESYQSGNRNNYVYLLASNCNRFGIPEYDALDKISARFDLPNHEIRSAIKSAYNNHSFEHAKFNNVPHFSAEHSDEVFDDVLKNTPCFPDSIFDNLPEILRKSCIVFTDKRERDVFLTGALAILSGCLPNVQGTYDRQTVFPNLFSFIIAPAASGKGVLKYAKMLADKHHEEVLKQSTDELDAYNIELQEYKNRLYTRKKGEPIPEAPAVPPFKVLYIPANASYAKVISHIKQNSGSGIICETEADTMGNVFKQEWGSYSDLLRKAFHHERISSSKKTNNEFIEVNQPRISVALSGTPGQVSGLIASSEDGLFSRFSFYAFKTEQTWRDVSPLASSINLTNHFSDIAVEICEVIHFLKISATNIFLSDAQWNMLNISCSNWLSDCVGFSGEESGSIVKRLGLMLFRICMLFASMRKYESCSRDIDITCTDNDFSSALAIANTLLEHSLIMFHTLPKQTASAINFRGSNKKAFFNELPPSFKRSDAIEIGKKHDMAERSVDAFLKSLIGKHLNQPAHGVYEKIS